jgi:hypothetical protein
MRTARRSTLPLVCLLLFGSALGFSRVGTTAASFLKIGVGARPCGMGEAFTAVVDDVTALFWNPSGLVQCPGTALQTGYNAWFAGIAQGYASLVLRPSKYVAVGVGASYLTSGRMEITTIEEPEGTGLFFTHTDLLLQASLARYLSSRFAFGVTAKYIQENVSAESASALALDLGSLYHTGWKDLRIGMTLSNFGGKMRLAGRDLSVLVDPTPGLGGTPEVEGNLSSGAWSLPLSFRIGLSARPLPQLLLALDGVHDYDSGERLLLGAEYDLGVIRLRCGYRLNSDEGGFTAGAGFSVPRIRLEYAAGDMGRLGLVHRVGLEVRP